MKLRALFAAIGLAFSATATAQPDPGVFMNALQGAVTGAGENLANGDPGGANDSLTGSDGLIQGSAGNALHLTLDGVAEQDPEKAQGGVDALVEAVQADGGPLDQLGIPAPGDGLPGGLPALPTPGDDPLSAPPGLSGLPMPGDNPLSGLPGADGDPLAVLGGLPLPAGDPASALPLP